MKEFRITKLVAFFLCAIMIFSTIVSSSDLTIETKDFTGTIISTDGVDL